MLTGSFFQWVVSFLKPLVSPFKTSELFWAPIIYRLSFFAQKIWAPVSPDDFSEDWRVLLRPKMFTGLLFTLFKIRTPNNIFALKIWAPLSSSKLLPFFRPLMSTFNSSEPFETGENRQFHWHFFASKSEPFWAQWAILGPVRFFGPSEPFWGTTIFPCSFLLFEPSEHFWHPIFLHCSFLP